MEELLQAARGSDEFLRRLHDYFVQPDAQPNWHVHQRVADAYLEIETALERGVLGEYLSGLLARYVAGLRKAKDEKTLRQILGLPPPVGAPSKAALWYELEENYWHFTENLGMSDEEALRVCWENFYPDKSYEIESKRPQGNSTAYAEQIKQIKKKLNAAAYRQPAKRGRKKRIKPD